MIHTLEIKSPGQGLHEFTAQLHPLLQRSTLEQGLCTLFLQHTSASLLYPSS